jgi:transcriptional regulator with XRE-family HTH domain
MLRLAENLRYLRLRADFTQEQMAEIVGFEFKFYQKLEGGRKPQVKIETVERLGKPFGLEAWQLLAPSRIFKRAKFKIPSPRSRSQRGPRAKWSGLARRRT